MKLVFMPSATADLMWMRTYYSSVFADGAKRAARQYRKACDTIRRKPLIGHALEDMEGVRELSIPRTPFSFIYRIVEDRVEILRVCDQRGDRAKLG
ncbi:MAG: type II toxin-antitoxin system RelE/ParE family toxin [Rhodospirillales bacterium]|nr:type II toxin-antitoxin system RelE/ParE family toxin [Rhodospirillales bacterium]